MSSDGKIDAGQVNIPQSDVTNSLTSILDTIYFMAGAIAVLIIVIAGYIFVTSSGSPEKVKTAKNAILGAVIGLVVIVMAFAITKFIIQRGTL